MLSVVKVDEISPQNLQGCGVEDDINSDIMNLSAEQLKAVIGFCLLKDFLSEVAVIEYLHRLNALDH